MRGARADRAVDRVAVARGQAGEPLHHRRPPPRPRESSTAETALPTAWVTKARCPSRRPHHAARLPAEVDREPRRQRLPVEPRERVPPGGRHQDRSLRGHREAPRLDRHVDRSLHAPLSVRPHRDDGHLVAPAERHRDPRRAAAVAPQQRELLGRAGEGDALGPARQQVEAVERGVVRIRDVSEHAAWSTNTPPRPGGGRATVSAEAGWGGRGSRGGAGEQQGGRTSRHGSRTVVSAKDL